MFMNRIGRLRPRPGSRGFTSSLDAPLRPTFHRSGRPDTATRSCSVTSRQISALNRTFSAQQGIRIGNYQRIHHLDYFSQLRRTFATALPDNASSTKDEPHVVDFSQNWDNQIQALIERTAASPSESPSLTVDHWAATERLLRVLQTQKDALISPARIRACFRLLDAQCSHVDANNKTKPPLDHSSLSSLLIAWRDLVFASLEQRVANNQHDTSSSKHQSSPDVLPDPAWVLTRIHEYTDKHLVESNVSYFNIVLHVMAKQHCPPEWGEEMIRAMLDKSERNDVAFHPTAATVYGIIELWAQSDRSEAPQRAEHYWSMFHNTWSTPEYRQRHGLPPLSSSSANDVVHSNMYCALMEAYSRHEAGEKAFQRIQQLYAQLPHAELEASHYNRVVRALGTCRHEDGADAARQILDQLCRNVTAQDGNETASNNSLVKPDTFTFLAVLTAYARQGRAREAETLFAHMKELATQYGEASLIPNIPCYNALVWAYAKVGESHKAEAVLTEMATAFGTQAGGETNETAIDWTTWNGVLASWAESEDPNATDQIAALLRRLEQMAGEGKIPGQALNANVYNKLLGAYARKQLRDRSTEAAEKAEELFHWMERRGELNPNMIPDEGSYYNLILAFANARQPAKSHEYLQQLCKKVHAKGIRIDQKSVAIVVEAWAKSRHPQAMMRAKEAFDMIETFGQKPDVVSYTSLLWALAKSPSVAKYQDDVLAIFGRMEAQYKAGDSFCKPSVVTYCALLYALCHADNEHSFARAVDLFQKLRNNHIDGIFVDTGIYNIMMHAYANRRNPEQMEQLYRELKTLSENPGADSLQINTNILVTRLQGWSQAGNPDMTSAALQDMVLAFREGIIERQPDTREFTAILQAWLRSKRPNAAEKAEAGLFQMIEFAKSQTFDCQPNIFSFVAVISAHAKSYSPDAGKKAFMIFREIARNGVEPNLIAYTEVIIALCRSFDKNQRNPAMMESLNKALQQLVMELASKESRFWNGKRSHVQHFDRIRNALERSRFTQKEELLAAFQTLESSVSKGL